MKFLVATWSHDRNRWKEKDVTAKFMPIFCKHYLQLRQQFLSNLHDKSASNCQCLIAFKLNSQCGNVNNAYIIYFLASPAMAKFYLEQMFLNFPVFDYSQQQPFQFKILIRKLTGLFIVHWGTIYLDFNKIGRDFVKKS